MKIAKERLIEIIKEEVNLKAENLKDTLNEDQEMKDFEAESAGSDEELSGYLEGLGIPLDKDGNPTKRPPLPKNWRKMPIKSVERRAFRMWYTTYGPGKGRGRKKGFKNKVAQARDKAIARRDKRNLSDFHPKVRAAMESADRTVAMIFKRLAPMRSNNAYIISKLKRTSSFEHKNLLKALKLYKKAAQAGNKRAKREVIMVQGLLRGDISSMPKAGQQPDPKPPKEAKPMSAKAAKAESFRLMKQAGMGRFLMDGEYRNNNKTFIPSKGMLKRYPKLKSSVNTSGGSNPEHRRLIILKKALGK